MKWQLDCPAQRSQRPCRVTALLIRLIEQRSVIKPGALQIRKQATGWRAAWSLPPTSITHPNTHSRCPTWMWECVLYCDVATCHCHWFAHDRKSVWSIVWRASSELRNRRENKTWVLNSMEVLRLENVSFDQRRHLWQCHRTIYNFYGKIWMCWAKCKLSYRTSQS